MLAHGFVMIIDVLWQPRWSQPSEFHVPNFGTPHLTADLLQQKNRQFIGPLVYLPHSRIARYRNAHILHNLFNNGHAGDTTEYTV